MTGERQSDEGRNAARFAQEWNFAFLLVALIAALLLAAGQLAAGVVAAALCLAAFLARYIAMRRQNRGFYGQQKQAR